MTETETIKKMLEDPESDNDEVNARIVCYIKNHEYGLNPITKAHSLKNGYGGWTSVRSRRYTTSLDAAMSIGAEELEGWDILLHGGTPYECVMILYSEMALVVRFSSDWLPEIPCAIAHARIQALEYVRNSVVAKNATTGKEPKT